MAVTTPKLLDASETADRLGVSVETLRRLVAAGSIPVVRFGPGRPACPLGCARPRPRRGAVELGHRARRAAGSPMNEVRRVYTFNGEEEMSAHLNLQAKDQQQLAEEMGVLPEDVTPETVTAYAEELRELGRGADAARVIAYLGHDSDDADEDTLYEQLSATLGLPAAPDDLARSYEEEEEDERFREFAPYMGIEADNA
jgi:excisionase family DNA binding protein